MKQTPAASLTSMPSPHRARALRLAAGAFALIAILAGAGGTACGGAAETGGSAGGDALELPAEVVPALASALDRYETLRSMLAQDAASDLAAVATRLTADLAEAKAAWPDATTGDFTDLRTEIDNAAEAAGRLAEAGDLLDSRRAFGEVSRHLLPAAAADARLRRGRHVFQCTMTETFALWVQADAEAANPYLGAAMPTCGERVTWGEAANESGGTS